MEKVTLHDLIDGKLVKIERVPGQVNMARSITIKTKSGLKFDLAVEWYGDQRDGESVIVIKNDGQDNTDVLVSKNY
jgi:hypothetical protein